MKEHVALKPKKEQAVLHPASLEEFRARADRMTQQLAERAFQLFEGRGCEHGHDLEDWFKAEAELLIPIPMRVKETAREVRIVAEVRGFNDDEVTFNLEKSQLTIRGKKQMDPRKAEQGESEIQMIYGSISLPSEVAPQKAHATLKHGILEIIAPKSATEIGKAIAARAA